MVKLSKEIERTFSTFRGELGGQSLSNNQLLDLLRKKTTHRAAKRSGKP